MRLRLDRFFGSNTNASVMFSMPKDIDANSLNKRVKPVSITTTVFIAVALFITLWSSIMVHWRAWAGVDAESYQFLRVSRNILSTIGINIFMGLLALPISLPPIFVVYLWMIMLLIDRLHANSMYRQITATDWLLGISELYNVHEPPIVAVLILAVYQVRKMVMFFLLVFYSVAMHMTLQVTADAASMEHWVNCCDAANRGERVQVECLGIVPDFKTLHRSRDWQRLIKTHLVKISRWQLRYMRYIATMEALHADTICRCAVLSCLTIAGICLIDVLGAHESDELWKLPTVASIVLSAAYVVAECSLTAWVCSRSTNTFATGIGPPSHKRNPPIGYRRTLLGLPLDVERSLAWMLRIVLGVWVTVVRSCLTMKPPSYRRVLEENNQTSAELQYTRTTSWAPCAKMNAELNHVLEQVPELPGHPELRDRILQQFSNVLIDLVLNAAVGVSSAVTNKWEQSGLDGTYAESDVPVKQAAAELCTVFLNIDALPGWDDIRNMVVGLLNTANDDSWTSIGMSTEAGNALQLMMDHHGYETYGIGVASRSDAQACHSIRQRLEDIVARVGADAQDPTLIEGLQGRFMAETDAWLRLLYEMSKVGAVCVLFSSVSAPLPTTVGLSCYKATAGRPDAVHGMELMSTRLAAVLMQQLLQCVWRYERKSQTGTTSWERINRILEGVEDNYLSYVSLHPPTPAVSSQAAANINSHAAVDSAGDSVGTGQNTYHFESSPFRPPIGSSPARGPLATPNEASPSLSASDAPLLGTSRTPLSVSASEGSMSTLPPLALDFVDRENISDETR